MKGCRLGWRKMHTQGRVGFAPAGHHRSPSFELELFGRQTHRTNCSRVRCRFFQLEQCHIESGSKWKENELDEFNEQQDGATRALLGEEQERALKVTTVASYRSGCAALKRNCGCKRTDSTSKYCGGSAWYRCSSMSWAPMMMANCSKGALGLQQKE